MDIEIFPHRILGSDTTEALLNDLESIDDVQRTVIHGPRFPKGEATLPDKYKERRVINIKGEDVVLQVKTARIFIELTMESTIKEIEEVCEKHIPFGFEINQDRANYIRKHKTVTDRIKYGSADIPDDLVGMTDQYSEFESHVNIINRDRLD
ncbi:methyl-coenzyme M reductase operon protein D [uncultured Methanobrevibacter sp.]|uniref:methyl-coenzyme M reductase operon protein D n=1 Tax=uncultured Methanobrevibacter sp. TaxID=253161 RepID=UPI0025E68B9A|nr:methyl-coenzyme M reductase operon protein D [uncultured Methanobrevibacter sp.]MCI6993788.1 methyl-coenzyme M reductase operon protein D [Methanobrevibacter sp.]